MAKTSKAAATPAEAPAIDQAAFFKVAEAHTAGTITFLSQNEAAGLVAAGLIEVDVNTPDPTDVNKRAVRLTPAGVAAVAETSDEDDDGETFEIDDDVPLAVRGGGRARDSKYPFHKLQVGQSFHVPAKSDKPNFSKNLSSAASQYAARFAKPLFNDDGSPKMETVTVHKKGPDGNRVATQETRQATEATVSFTVRTVGADDKRGEGYRVYRTK
jgi:hypothetical protein